MRVSKNRFVGRVALLLAAVAVLSGCGRYASNLDKYIGVGSPSDKELTLSENETLISGSEYKNFILKGQARTEEGGEAAIYFHLAGKSSGYEVALRNGQMDGTIKTGSLVAVRNLYRSLVEDGEWFDFEIAVRDKNIVVTINGTNVVWYTEPATPYRTVVYEYRRIGKGAIAVKGKAGKVELRSLQIEPLPLDARNVDDVEMPVNERTDGVIRFQQRNFPVIDYHVHLKGGLTKEMAYQMSIRNGINYGVAPNAGEGGVGRMLANDEEVYEYYNEVKDMPFLRGVQGEGRRWTHTFSQEALGVFDYLFTDAMTIVDHKGRISRIYRPEEVDYTGLTYEEYMDHLVDQTVKILTNEPADIFANPTYLPRELMPDYDKYWTNERINKVLDVMVEHGIALEINPTLRLPSTKIVRMAKERGIKFTFGSNNANAEFGKLEYCFDVVNACRLTKEDMWFPSMSRRAERKVVHYNKFD
ncbi:MAG: DUF1080 domain-containing protein [Alistipes sp.]|nr:DUF1080 domain-containing protein [Alistipes sp.]